MEDKIPDPLVPKFDIGQIVFCMIENNVCSAEITSRCVTENLHDNWASTDAQKELWQTFGPSGIQYRTVHGTFTEDQLFANKAELLDSL